MASLATDNHSEASSDEEGSLLKMERPSTSARGKLKAFLSRAAKPVVGRKSSNPAQHALILPKPPTLIREDQEPASGADQTSAAPAYHIRIEDLRRSDSTSTLDLGAIPTPTDYKRAANSTAPLEELVQRRNEVEDMLHKSNDAVVQLYDQLQLSKEDYKITQELLSIERQATFVLKQQLVEAENRQQHLLIAREQQETISMSLSDELQKERYRMKLIQDQFSQLVAENDQAQKRYAKLREVYKQQQIGLHEALEHAAELDKHATHQSNELRGMVLLNTEFTRMKSTEEASKRERSQLRRQLAHHEAELGGTTARLGEARAQVGRLELEVKRLQEEVRAADENQKSTESRLLEASLELERQLDESQAAQAMLEEKLLEVQEALASSNARIHTLVQELQTTRTAYAEAHQLQIETDSALASAHAQVADLESSLASVQAQNEALQSDLTTFKEQAVQRQTALNNQLQDQATRLDVAASMQNDLTTARDVALTQLKQLQGTNHQLATQLESSTAQFQQDFGGLTKARDVLQVTLADLQVRLRDIEKERDNVIRQSATDAQTAAQTAEELQSRLTFHENEVSRIRHTKMQEVDELKRTNDSLADRLDELRSLRDLDTSALRERISELNRQVTAASNLHGHMLLQNQDLADRMTALRTSLEEEQSKLVQSHNDIAIIKLELEASREDFRKVSIEKQELEGRLSTKLDEILQNQLDIASLKAAVQNARDDMLRVASELEASQSARAAEVDGKQALEATLKEMELDRTDLEQQLLQIPVLQADNVRAQDKLRETLSLLDASRTIEQSLRESLADHQSEMEAVRAELEAEKLKLVDSVNRLSEFEKVSAHRDALEEEVKSQANRIYELQEAQVNLQAQVALKDALQLEIRQIQSKLVSEMDSLAVARNQLTASETSRRDIERMLEGELKHKEELAVHARDHEETTRRLVSTAHEVLQSCLQLSDSPLKLIPAQVSPGSSTPTTALKQLEDLLESIAQALQKTHDLKKAEATASQLVAKHQSPQLQQQHQQQGKPDHGGGKKGNKALQVRPSNSSDNLTDETSPSDHSEISNSNLQARLRAMAGRDPEMFNLFRHLSRNGNAAPMHQPTPPWMNHNPFAQTPPQRAWWDTQESEQNTPQHRNNGLQVVSARLNGPSGTQAPTASFTDPTAGWNSLQRSWGLPS